MLHAKFQDSRSLGAGEDILKFFYHIWAGRSSWSCDLDYFGYIGPPFLPIDASYKIWL